MMDSYVITSVMRSLAPVSCSEVMSDYVGLM